MREALAGARDLMLVLLIGQVLSAWVWSMTNPEAFGRWLQKIDNGRFEMIDCDCTEPLE